MKDLFCAKCQDTTPHTGIVDGNGEFVFTCGTFECGRFVKFSAETTTKDFDGLLAKHEEANVGQVSLAEQRKKLDELLGGSPVKEEVKEEVEEE